VCVKPVAAEPREDYVMKFLKRIFGLGIVAAAGYALWRAYERRRVDAGVAWDPQPFPYPPQPRPEPRPEPATATPAGNRVPWIEPDDGACPATHPVKAKLASGIFHVPGGANYDRTNADRCYLSVEAAENDGLRRSLR
jgi:hypothetical protein